MSDSDLERLDAALADINARLIWLEIKAGVPMSQLDRMIAKAMDARRRAPIEQARRNIEAFHEAEAEAERAGHRGPIDRFLQRLKAGRI
jgi:hypothetical protein